MIPPFQYIYLCLKSVMAADAGPAAALVPVVALDTVPVPWMGIDLETGARAMAGHADIAVTVAGTAGLQIAPRLRGMIR